MGWRPPPGPGNWVPAARSSGYFTWTPVGSLRSPGDPSCAFAPLLDPGRIDVPLPWRSHRCCPRLLSQRRLRTMRISGLAHAASAPALLRFAFRVAIHAQGWLPPGWLAFTERVSNPLDHYERFQITWSSLGGQVQVNFAPMPGTVEYVRTGKLRPLAVTTAQRSQVLPELPVLSDFVPGYEASVFYGVGAPRSTPAEIVNKINNEINAAFIDPGMTARLANLGGTPLSGSPADFGKLIVDEAEKWAKVVKSAGIKAE